MARVRLLLLPLLLLVWAGRAGAAQPQSRLAGFRAAAETMAKNAIQTARSPKKVARLAASYGIGLGAGMLAMHLGAPVSATAFASYTANTVVDRLMDQRWPARRAVGQPAPPPRWRDALSTLAGATTTAITTPLLLHEASAIPILSLGAPLVLARPALRLVSSAGVSAIALGVRMGTNMWLRLVGKERLASMIP